MSRTRTHTYNAPIQRSFARRLRRSPILGGAVALSALLLGLAGHPRPLRAQDEGVAKPGGPRVMPSESAVRSGPTDDAELASLGLVAGRPRVKPARLAAPPRIDGRLDDPAWKQAVKITEFSQQTPVDGAPGTERTEVWVAYDADNLYFGFYAHYSDPSILRASRVDRDRSMRDDLITVYLDTFLDQQRAYDFDVNGYGVQGDGIVNAGGGGGGRRGPGGGGGIPHADRSWDALFESAGRIVSDGYTAEMAIPFKSIRYPSTAEGEPNRWGLQIVRDIKGKNEESDVWAPMSRDQSSFMSQMGLIEGMTGLSTSHNLEILPTVTAIQYGSIDPVPAAFVNQATKPDAGVSVKYGLTSNLIADFTVNPDFSQIESDQPQIEVNQRYPVFYQELRPFFVEGAEIFNVSAPVTFVHTRTIVDPDYGAKLTGKIGRTSVGLLAANDRAPGKVDDPTDPAYGQKAQTFIGRAKLDLYSESHVGALVTDREFLGGFSRLAGLDGNFRLGATRAFNFSAMSTWNREPGGSMSRGHILDARIHQNGRNLDWNVYATEITPDFATKVGFVRRTDMRQVNGSVGYRFWPQSWIINWGPRINYQRNYDFEQVLQDENLQMGLNFSFSRNIGLGANVSRSMERYNDVDFRKSGFFMRTNVNTSRSFSLGAGFGMGDAIRYVADPFLGHQRRWSVDANLRPIPRLTSHLSLDASRLTDPRNNDEVVFDVKILRAFSTFQLTDRLSTRNITQFNTYDRTVDLNLLLTYRVNAGTVFFVGYDDHYQQADLIQGDRNGDGVDEQLYFQDSALRRTNRAFFAKFQYLLRM